jgi:hypothetical protein
VADWSLFGHRGAASLPHQHLVQRIRRGLWYIQYRSDLIDGCVAETGLTVRSTTIY